MVPRPIHPKARGASLTALLGAFAVAPLSVAAVEDAPEALALFENHIRPALIEHCHECHSEEHDKRKGGLWLDRRSGWETGGDSGPAIVPGDPDASLLMATIRYHDPELEMPPKEKLPEAVIARFEEWIRQGAVDPRSGEAAPEEKGIDLEAGRQFWSFRPITDPAPPEVEDEAWPRGMMDRFLLARLEEAGLRPAPDAAPEDLLRRVTVLLTGLPPTVEEQDAYLADPSAEAFAKVVDRLLASDAYAERWGRHWLDITRYADTSGGGRTMALPDAWRFRDYVIDSFRKDKPLDQLIREHIAGDLLPAEDETRRMEQLIGTGYLLLGPHNYENQDKELLDLEIADEQIDTIGRSFLGMTIGCARCHDHKFDPIPTRDYYALTGIFTSTRSVRHANVSQWYTQPYQPTPEQAAAITDYERKSEPLKKKIDELRRELRRLEVNAGGAAAENPAADTLPGLVLDESDAELSGEWMESSSNRRWVGAGYRHDLNDLKGEKIATYRFEVPRDGEREVRVSWSAGTNRAANVPITVRHADGETVTRVDQRESPSFDGLFHSLGKFRFEAGTASVEIGTDGTSGVVIIDAVQLMPTAAETETDEPAGANTDALLAAGVRRQVETLQADLTALEKARPKLATVMAVADAEEPADTPVRIRGLVRNFGENAPRGFLQVAMPADRPTPDIAPGQSGRRELAEWVASPDNPLTARVLANRIWMHLFGEGLVRSVDNFGTTGVPPTHPELLDHLASRLIAHDWSARALIREILLTRAWAMSTDNDDPRAATADPENHLLWRAHRRKLDAETLRDSLLMLGGNLDPAGGGESLPDGFRSEFGFEFTSLKRAVYLPSFRNQMHEIFTTFDFANPNFVVGQRSRSNIPTQALYLMNSPFVHEQAALAAGNLLASDTEDRLGMAYRKTLGRPPRAEERALAESFLLADGGDAESWSALMRTLFSCVDFQYLR